MKLSEDQKRLAELRFNKCAVDIGEAAKERMAFAKSNNLSRGWEPNDPKFFIGIADVYAQFSSRLYSAFAESLFEICKESDLLLDDEMIGDIKAEISKKRRELISKARKASIGDPYGDSEGVIRQALARAQEGIDQDVERLALEYKSRATSAKNGTEKPWILSLHGIRSRAAWQKELAAELNRAGFNCLSLDYGYFLALQLIVPHFRTKKLRWFREEYARHVNRSGGRPSIVAHSFGTYIVAGALERYSEIKFDKVIFAGAIVDRAYKWSDYVPSQVGTVLNDCGGRDFWVMLAPWLVRDAGPAGRLGFFDGARGSVLNRFRPWFGHSEHFYDLNYVRSWVPFLFNGKCEDAVPPVCQSEENRNWRFIASVTTFGGLSAILVVTMLIRFVGHWPWWLPSFLHWHRR